MSIAREVASVTRLGIEVPSLTNLPSICSFHTLVYIFQVVHLVKVSKYISNVNLVLEFI